RAAYEVYKHMDLLRSNSSNSNSSAEAITQDSTFQRPKFSKDPFSKQSKSYSLTKAAAIRMVTFSLLFAIVNFFACITSFLAIFKGVSIDKEPSSVDWV
ncbi:17133_t:CDS:1, partial [Dentiscutata heterogama]